ncbi:MAG: cobalamin-binding protein [Firmicutes bacterium]|nr:cobalamin-binding protein [Dethiobacter sp.]MBS3889050.1 cobalamin-binding protein [Bacillota bacterium]MBS4053766.1 cobalamin-binding protein [Thermaerobacter sp.]
MKKLSLLALIAILALVAAGCAPITALFQRPIVLTDDFGRQITLEKPAVRIVSLAPSTTELLFALGLSDKIVGVTEFCNYPALAQTKEKVGGFGPPSVEKIVSVKPDLVVAASLHQAVVEQLEQLNIPVLAVDPKNIAQVIANAALLGQATGTTRQAQAIEQELTAAMREVEEKTRGLAEGSRPLVYFEIWHDPITSAGPNTFIHELITRAGGINLASNAATNFPVLSLEEILAQKPTVMFRGHGPETVEAIKQRANWETVPAIANNRVYLVNEDLVLRPGPRLALGLREMARLLHPDLWR